MLTTAQLLSLADDVAVLRNRADAAIGPPPANRAAMQSFLSLSAAEREQMTVLSGVSAHLCQVQVLLHRAADAAAPVVEMVLL